MVRFNQMGNESSICRSKRRNWRSSTPIVPSRARVDGVRYGPPTPRAFSATLSFFVGRTSSRPIGSPAPTSIWSTGFRSKPTAMSKIGTRSFFASQPVAFRSFHPSLCLYQPVQNHQNQEGIMFAVNEGQTERISAGARDDYLCSARNTDPGE